jgi:hypothetical protein
MISRRFTSDTFARPIHKYARGILDDIRNFVRSVRTELPTPSATDVRCRSLQRQNECRTKKIMGNSRRDAEIVFRTGMRE